MADKDKIRDMLDAIIDDNDEKAQVDFHSFAAEKMKEIISDTGTEDDTDD